MPLHLPTTQTVVVIAGFILIYLLLLLKKTVRGGLDLYEFLLLSMVAVVPGVFTFFPKLTKSLSDLVGVAFPFVVMFGALFVIIFIFLHRLTLQIHKLEKRSRLLIQENGLLREGLERLTAGR